MGMFSNLGSGKKIDTLGTKGSRAVAEKKKSGRGVRSREDIVGSTNSGVGRLQHAQVTGGVSRPSVAPSKPRGPGGNARAHLSSLAGAKRLRRKAGPRIP